MKSGWPRNKLGMSPFFDQMRRGLPFANGYASINRLANLLASPSLAPTKLDELKVKINILSAFAAQKAGEAYDSAEEILEGAWDSAKQIPIQAKDGLDQFADAVEEKAKRIRSDL